MYLRNRSPGAAPRSKTPYEMFFGQPPSIRHLQIFGSYMCAMIPAPHQPSKLSPRARLVRFVGYSSERRAFRLLKESGDIIESRDAQPTSPPTTISPSMRKVKKSPKNLHLKYKRFWMLRHNTLNMNSLVIP